MLLLDAFFFCSKSVTIKMNFIKNCIEKLIPDKEKNSQWPQIVTIFIGKYSFYTLKYGCVTMCLRTNIFLNVLMSKTNNVEFTINSQKHISSFLSVIDNNKMN